MRVFRLDREAVMRRLELAAREMLEHRADVLEVRLIGSLARGEARPGSDADLVVTVTASDQRFPDRALSLLPYLSGAGIGCDVLVYTADELDRMRSDGSRISRVMEEEGIVLANR